MGCIFCKIASHEMPTQIQYEDDDIIAFNDIHPLAPVHILVVPKQHIDEFYSLKDTKVLDSVHKAIKKLICDNQLLDKGYKVEVNGGGAQLVNHLHFHLMGPTSKPQA